ncbi:hypothetical protein [Sphingomonas sp.]|uniref:hypothetical protein n=1 Tax=Sphingomonas sp. TaxID=28214 RepID=UPI003AFF768D
MQVAPRKGMVGLALFPLLLIPILFYDIMAAVSAAPPPGGTTPTLLNTLHGEALAIPMLSGSTLSLAWGDLLLLLSVGCLLAEVIKSAHTGSAAIVNHMLSLGLFIVCLVEFLLLPSFASSAFFLITMIVLLDALAGMVVTIIAARRDFDVGATGP